MTVRANAGVAETFGRLKTSPKCKRLSFSTPSLLAMIDAYFSHTLCPHTGFSTTRLRALQQLSLTTRQPSSAGGAA